MLGLRIILIRAVCVGVSVGVYAGVSGGLRWRLWGSEGGGWQLFGHMVGSVSASLSGSRVVCVGASGCICRCLCRRLDTVGVSSSALAHVLHASHVR